MSKLDRIKKRNEQIAENQHQSLQRMEDVLDVMSFKAEALEYSEDILKSIEGDFSNVTGILNMKDISLLFVAIGLLCTKWIIMSNICPLLFDFSYVPMDRESRLDSAVMGDIDKMGKSLVDFKKTLETTKKNREKLVEKLKVCTQEQRTAIEKKIRNNERKQEKLEEVIKFLTDNPDINDKIIRNNKKIERILHTDRKKLAKDIKEMKSSGNTGKYRTVSEILLRPVPYDAMKKKSEDFSLPNDMVLVGTTHHAYTLGHDPVLGFIFGTMDIMARTISLKLPLIPTYWVEDNGNIISGPTEYPSCLSSIIASINSAKEDDKRIAAATIRQGLHLLSDKYCKTGLPIPTMTAEKAQKLIEKNWNSVECKKLLDKVLKTVEHDAPIIALQFAISFLINQIIKAIHLLLYDEEVDGDYALYEVRTRKILLVSNCIATSSNLIYTTLTRQVSNLDIGGAIETIHRICSDTKYISNIKAEYIRDNFKERLRNIEDESDLYEIGDQL